MSMENVPYIEDLPAGAWATKEEIQAEIVLLRQQLKTALDLTVEANGTVIELRKQKDDLVAAVTKALIGSCNCMTKTPEVSYHKAHCGYRILSEALTKIKRGT